MVTECGAEQKNRGDGEIVGILGRGSGGDTGRRKEESEMGRVGDQEETNKGRVSDKGKLDELQCQQRDPSVCLRVFLDIHLLSQKKEYGTQI